MKTYPFSRLQKALLAVGSFSCLGLSSISAYAETEGDTPRLAPITVKAQTAGASYINRLLIYRVLRNNSLLKFQHQSVQ